MNLTSSTGFNAPAHDRVPSTVPSNLPLSLAKLVESLQNQPVLSPEIVCQCVLAAGVQSEDLLPWADFTHPIADSYGRQLVYDQGNFEVMVMSWVPGDFSAIHDHGATQWGAVQCFGAAEHYVYDLDGDQLRTRAFCPYTPGSIKSVDGALIHQMGNAGSSPFLSLHVYGCNDPCQSITGNARLFDLLEASIQYTDGGVFFCLPEADIRQRRFGVQADAATRLRHHQQMRDRIHRSASAGPLSLHLQTQLAQLNEQIAGLMDRV